MDKVWTMEQEAQNLTARMESVKNRAKLARDHKIKGGGALIYQHMKGVRPISLEAAKAYAEAFGCEIEGISPRLASLISMPSKNHPLRPPILEDAEWNALSAKRREFIERLALSDIPDSLIDVLQSVLDTIRPTLAQPPIATKQAPKIPATAVRGGPPGIPEQRVHHSRKVKKHT